MHRNEIWINFIMFRGSRKNVGRISNETYIETRLDCLGEKDDKDTAVLKDF